LTPEEILTISFTDRLELPEDAVAYLIDLWNLIQVLDDAADGDSSDRSAVDRAIWTALAGMPMNAFYERHRAWLVPAMAQATLKWMASDAAERAGQADARSYMWRAGYYDVVCLVVGLVHGPSSQRSWDALALYGESLAEYMKEFDHA